MKPVPRPDAAPEFFAVPAAPDETLDLGRLVLRRWSADDIDALGPVVERSVAHLTPFMGWAAESSRETTLDYLARSEREWLARESFNFSMRRAEDGAVVGSCGLMSRVGPGVLEVGYWVAVDQVRQGYAALTAAGLTEAGLAVPGIACIEIHHDRANDASGRVPARLGFTRIGELPVAPTAPSETGTHVVWAMAADDWAASPGRSLLPHRS